MTTTTSADEGLPFPTPLHIRYIHGLDERRGEFEYWTSEHLRLSGIYWGLTALDLMLHPDSNNTPRKEGEADALLQPERSGFARQAILDSVLACWDRESGGFGGWAEHDPHLLYTLSAIQLLVTVDGVAESLGPEGRARTIAYIAGLQREDGSFQGDRWGEVDSRFSYCAVSALSLLGALDAIRLEPCIQFILACGNADGGFGSVPGAESHAGQIFCCVGALAILGQLGRLDQDATGWWLAERQLPGGGLNGRPEKLEDVCYSWWVLSSLAMLSRLHWIARAPLVRFILSCQDLEHGGFSDRAEDMTDVFHTLFGVAALSLLGYPGVGRVDARYCMATWRLPAHCRAP